MTVSEHIVMGSSDVSNEKADLQCHCCFWTPHLFPNDMDLSLLMAPWSSTLVKGSWGQSGVVAILNTLTWVQIIALPFPTCPCLSYFSSEIISPSKNMACSASHHTANVHSQRFSWLVIGVISHSPKPKGFSLGCTRWNRKLAHFFAEGL